ncbi:hypothetical protein ACHAXT_002287 [Thalassiosira profunda]
MMTRRAPSSLLAAAALLALVLSLVTPASAFTAVRPSALARTTLLSPAPIHLHRPANIPPPLARSSTTSLRMGDDTDGRGTGKVLLVLAMLANVWAFSIPVEFRRARFCTEEDVRLYPDRHCMTFDMWKSGIADYYANGGGVEFDFSIEDKD